MRKSVELATKMRMQNLTQEEMVARIVREKIDIAQYENADFLRDDFKIRMILFVDFANQKSFYIILIFLISVCLS